MSKRLRSPDSLAITKRRLTIDTSSSSSRLPISFDKFLYDELILQVFSYLSWQDLCMTQSVSKTWARLGADNELWREMYINEYGRSRLRGSRGFIARRDRREVRPLPVGIHSDHDQRKDWKWMFRVSSNWRRGRCIAEDVAISPLEAVSTSQSAVSSPSKSELMLLAGPWIVTASCLPTKRPRIILTDHEHPTSVTLTCDPIPQGDFQVTSLALDQSPPKSGRLSLACFLSTGDIFVFSFNATDPSSLHHSLHYRPSRPSARTNIIDTAYYHPLLVTLADPISLSVFDLSSGSIRHTQTLTAFTCYPPASLVLSSRSSTQFKLIITYTIPVYPHHWSVGVSEIKISRVTDTSLPMPSLSGLSSGLSFREDFRSSASTMTVLSTRTIRAFDIPHGWIDTTTLLAMREQWGRKLLSVAAVQTDGKWIVLAPGNDIHLPSPHSHGAPLTPSTSQTPRSSVGLQLYRLIFPSHCNSVSASPPRICFVRTLHGHTSPILAMTLADGRCISLGKNGSIWVWDLEGGSGAQVASSDNIFSDSVVPAANGIISFDERRIVSAIAGKVVIRRFDI